MSENRNPRFASFEQLLDGLHEAPRCAYCNHFHGSHIGPDNACIVERVSGPASGADTAPAPGDPHPGRIVEVCGCRGFV